MKNPRKLLKLATKMARIEKDGRTYCFGAVAIRDDDVLVYAYNGHSHEPTPPAHCEARLCRKLDRGATVYLVRLTRDKVWANSKPCHHCMKALRRAKVKKVYYSVAPNQWDSLTP